MKGELNMAVVNRENLPLLITQKQAKAYLGITSYAFYKMVHEKNVPVTKIGGKYYINRDRFFDYVDIMSTNKKD